MRVSVFKQGMKMVQDFSLECAGVDCCQQSEVVHAC